MRLTVLDPQDSLRLKATGVYESVETAFVKRTLRPGQTFVDVGAHIGYYSAMAAEIVGPRGAVWAFEPHPGNFELLEKNVERFGITVTMFQKALSDQLGYQRLYLSGTNSGDHRLYRVRGRKSVVVTVTMLDSFDLAPIDFIKIDVQGNELRVLKGARETLERSPNVAGIVEFSPDLLRLSGTKPMDLIAALKDLGFTIWMRQKDGIAPIPKTDMSRRKHHVNLIIDKKKGCR